ncbi:MAG: hypothetical protein JWM73_3087 [Solirubrobacterales bacterium]|jgi:hypothetical protein|nr:hypothetical protein [Solirubrobacterales bacterium]
MFRKSLKVAVALLVAGLFAGAASAPVNANVTEGNPIDLSIWNNSSEGVRLGYCPRGHVSIHYKFGTHHNPCNVTSEIHQLHARGGKFKGGGANPAGAVATSNTTHKSFFFYVRNPSVGRPFIEANGHHLTMVEGQETHMVVAGGLIAFHRRGDVGGRKQFIIEILRMPPS